MILWLLDKAMRRSAAEAIEGRMSIMTLCMVALLWPISWILPRRQLEPFIIGTDPAFYVKPPWEFRMAKARTKAERSTVLSERVRRFLHRRSGE